MSKASVSRSHLQKTPRPPLQPRKLPVQARSAETVRAIREATIQVLLKRGNEKLTTTEIAQRAGVSVGTLYQYYPNKAALLQGLMQEHLEHVTVAVEQVCLEERNQPLPRMVSALVEQFLTAKLRDGPTSAALYAVSETLDVKPVLRAQQVRVRKALASLLRTAPGVRFPDLETTVLLLYASMAGVLRAVLEAGAGKPLVSSARRELNLMVEGHLTRSSVPR